MKTLYIILFMIVSGLVYAQQADSNLETKKQYLQREFDGGLLAFVNTAIGDSLDRPLIEEELRRAEEARRAEKDAKHSTSKTPAPSTSDNRRFDSNDSADEPEFERMKEKLSKLENSNSLSFAILGFGLIIVVAILIHLGIRKQGIGSNAIKLIGISLVITSALFVIVAGFSQDQISPVIGLLGTIVGYIIGSKSGEGKGKD